MPQGLEGRRRHVFKDIGSEKHWKLARYGPWTPSVERHVQRCASPEIAQIPCTMIQLGRPALVLLRRQALGFQCFHI